MKDIQDMDDVRLLVDMFYQKVNQDALLSPVFNDIARVDWLSHMPKMYSFWGTLLLGEASYRGSPFDKHLPLPIDAKHFDRWMALFVETVDQHFRGNKAEEAKQKAQSIAGIFSFKMKTIKT